MILMFSWFNGSVRGFTAVWVDFRGAEVLRYLKECSLFQRILYNSTPNAVLIITSAAEATKTDVAVCVAFQK